MATTSGKGVWCGRGAVWRAGVALLCVVVLVAAVVTGALVTEVADDDGPRAIPGEPALPAPAPGLVAASAAAPRPDPATLARVLDPLAAVPQIGDLGARVVDDETGDVLWEREPDEPKVPASATKLLTAVAALQALPADHTADTVLSATDDGMLVVTPGGDVAMSAGDSSPLFPGAATVAGLAKVVRDAGVTPTSIVVEQGPYTGPALAPGWSAQDIAGGNIAPMEPWMLDAGRTDPAEEYSPRVDAPELTAARALGRELGVDASAISVAGASGGSGSGDSSSDGGSANGSASSGGAVSGGAGSGDAASGGAATDDAHEIGRVHSAPLSERIRSMLVHSDNVLAESVCREVALSRHSDTPADFAGGTTAVLDVLREKGFDVSGVHLDDCSGMSGGDRVSPAVLAGVLRTASAPDAPRPLRALLDALPVAAVSGTLTDRYGPGAASSGAGWVRAKTGTLTGTSALAGTVTDVDGRAMSFALLSTGTSPADARPALDRIAAALRDCGCR